MKKIITISREYGSGGRIIAQQLAQKLDIPFYDKEIVALIAKESGLSLDFIEETGEYSTGIEDFISLFNSSFYGQVPLADGSYSLKDSIEILQHNIVKKIAEDGPCVIVGRSADYILREREDCLNTFIHAPFEDKYKRVIETYGVSSETAKSDILKKDKGRATHYKHYTELNWGDYKNYHLSIDSSIAGLEGTCDIIIEILNRTK